MGLRKAKGNMYSWVTHMWSPIKGCQFGCKYCYAKGYGYGREVNLDEEDLNTRLGRGKTIFVGHLCDMWGGFVGDDIIIKVLEQCARFPGNEYVFQSKNPRRFVEFQRVLANKFWVPNIPFMLGTTIETDRYPGDGKFTLAPPISQRADAMIALKPWKRFVTIEPIMDFDLKKLVNMIKAIDPRFVTIGADSKGHGLLEPHWEKVDLLIDELGKFVEIRQKSNLDRLKRK